MGTKKKGNLVHKVSTLLKQPQAMNGTSHYQILSFIFSEFSLQVRGLFSILHDVMMSHIVTL